MPYEVGALLCYLKGLKITAPNTLKSSKLNYKFIAIFNKKFMYKIIATTIDTKKNAMLVIDSILSESLSPCVQLIDKVQSFYKWRGNIEENSEFLILIKCFSDNEEAIKEIILKKHTYEVPEIIISDFDILNSDYANWFADNSI